MSVKCLQQVMDCKNGQNQEQLGYLMSLELVQGGGGVKGYGVSCILLPHPHRKKL